MSKRDLVGFDFGCMFLVDMGVNAMIATLRWGEKMDLITVAKFLSTALVIVFFGLALI